MVKWVKIGDVAKRNKGMNITAGRMKEIDSPEGTIRIFAGGNTVANVFPKDIEGASIINVPSVIVKSRGNVAFEYYDGCFTHKNEMWSYEAKEGLNIKYLYYYLSFHTDDFIMKAKASSVKLPQLCVADTDDFEIPLPSLSEQQRIVDILDKFEGMVENVEKELLLRQKQYEVYREKVIFSIPIIKRACRLSGVTKILRGKRLTKKELSDNNKYPVYHGGIEPIGRYNDYNRNADTVMIINVGASAGTVGFCNEKFWSSDGSFCIEKTDKVIDKYLYYYLLCKEHDIKSQVRYAGIPTLDQAVIENIEIPIPYLDKQQEIVEKLDKFEEMISTLKKELELRKKQYEYYREKLLTFE